MSYNELLQEAKLKISLIEYVSATHEVKKVGINTYGVHPCPVCGEGNNHFRISNKEKVELYNPFQRKCCNGGSIIDYLQEVEGLTKEEAFSKTFRLAGMEEPPKQTDRSAVAPTKAAPIAPKPKSKTAVAKAQVKPTPTKTNDYTELINQLHKNSSRTDYFKKRGLSQKIIDQYKLGFHEQGLNYAISQNVGLQENQNAYNAAYRYFLPIWDINHSCSYFIARIDDTAVTEGNRKPYKTHNLKGHALRLFNDRYLQDFSLTGNFVFVVEGIFDALSLEEFGHKAVALNSINNVAKLLEGLEQNKQQLKNKIIILMADNDTEGQQLFDYQAEIQALGFRTLLYQLPEDERIKDINDFLVADRVACEKHINDFLNPIINKDRVSDYLSNYIQDLNEHKNKKAISTGFEVLNRKLGGGMYPGLIVLGAIPSLGKTTLAVQIADNIAEKGQDVLFFSLEMSKLELVSKSLSREQFKVSPKTASGTREIMNGDFDNDTMKTAAMNYIPTSKNLFIVEGGFDTNVMELKERIDEHIRLRGTKPVVFVDYLQILRPTDERLNDKQAVDRNITQLKIISRQHDIPIVVISSFNRMNYATAVGFESFKESGSVEYTADVMIGLQLEGIHELADLKKDGERKAKLNKLKAENPRRIELVILKNRNGPAFATIGYQFYPKFNFFTKERER